jgi:hypothetical protein
VKPDSRPNDGSKEEYLNMSALRNTHVSMVVVAFSSALAAVGCVAEAAQEDLAEADGFAGAALDTKCNDEGGGCSCGRGCSCGNSGSCGVNGCSGRLGLPWGGNPAGGGPWLGSVGGGNWGGVFGEHGGLGMAWPGGNGPWGSGFGPGFSSAGSFGGPGGYRHWGHVR